jgi:hypothetical protein
VALQFHLQYICPVGIGATCELRPVFPLGIAGIYNFFGVFMQTTISNYFANRLRAVLFLIPAANFAAKVSVQR